MRIRRQNCALAVKDKLDAAGRYLDNHQHPAPGVMVEFIPFCSLLGSAPQAFFAESREVDTCICGVTS